MNGDAEGTDIRPRAGGETRLWRVVLDDGTTHGVVTRVTQSGLVVRRADNYGHNVLMPSYDYAREGVTRLCSRNGWPVVEVLAPGEPTRAELRDAVRDYLAAQDAIAANAANIGAFEDRIVARKSLDVLLRGAT